MNIKYLVEITDPETHLVKVKVYGQRPEKTNKLEFFIPSWSPGSYLMREYSRNIRTIRVFNKTGEYLYFDQKEKGIWEIDWEKSEVKTASDEFTIEYDVYCHDLTVRTSHIDVSHAFLHGPSYLIGFKDQEILKPKIEFKFPGLWSKLHTAMPDISDKRDVFLYETETYDDLLDSPVEIGCHESDGFMFDGKEHHLVWYGDQYDHPYDLKADIKKIVETVGSHFSDVPYDKYMFITHLVKNKFGGLEHKNSTALQFDGRKLKNRKDYLNWLSLVAHEYFHTWNVKRIRPVELGPFDYTIENYTKLHWLTEGLTSFMDELFVLRSGLMNLKEYLVMQKQNLHRYYSTAGKKFHSLEDSSFNAWIKLYRPDEFSNLSSISYYLKGGLVFSTLHFELKKINKSINDVLTALWDRYKANPDVGVTKDEVLEMIEKIGNKEIRDRFDMRVATTEDIDFESYYYENGMQFIWEESNKASLGVDWDFRGSSVVIGKVHLDQAAYKSGLNAGDEIIAVNRIRFSKEDANNLDTILTAGKTYTFTISRLDKLYEIPVNIGVEPRILKDIQIVDEQKAMAVFS